MALIVAAGFAAGAAAARGRFAFIAAATADCAMRCMLTHARARRVSVIYFRPQGAITLLNLQEIACTLVRTCFYARPSPCSTIIYVVPLHWTLMQEGGSKQPLQRRALQLRITHPVVAMLQRLLRVPAWQHSRTIARSLLNPARRLVCTHIWRPVQRKLH